MRFPGLIGGSYESQAVTGDQEQTWNWYPEKLPGDRTMLLPVPGVEPVSAVYDGVGRGHLSMDGREFGHFGDTVYEIFENGTKQSLGVGGAGANDKATSPVTIDTNGDLGGQLLVVSDEGAWTADLTATTPVTAAVAALTGKSTMGGYIDGYGLCLDADTSTLYISALGDFTTWTTGTDFAQRSLKADPWKALKVVGRYAWLFEEFTTEIWQDTGARFPFAPLANNVIEYGTAAPYSAAVMGAGDVVWLAQNKHGRVCVMRSGGVNPQVISDPALEHQISKYTDISGAIGDSYSWNGHDFYLLNFDTDNVTWCWDLTTGFWHRRGTWNTKTSSFQAWSPRHFVKAFGDVRSLDRMISTPADQVDSGSTTSFVYRLSDSFNVDVNGKPIRRVRRAPLLLSEDKRMFFSALEVLADVGEAQAKETLGTVALTAQTASIAETTLFTVGSEATSYVVEWSFRVTTTTTDYALNGTVWWYVGGTKIGHYLGQVVEGETDFAGSISIRADAGTAVSYTVTYTSTVGTMAYSADLSVYVPGATDPQMMLRTSNDGGRTWGTERMRSAGKTGEYGKRIRWTRLGSGRRRVFEVSVTDPIQWNLTDAYLKASVGQPGDTSA